MLGASFSSDLKRSEPVEGEPSIGARLDKGAPEIGGFANGGCIDDAIENRPERGAYIAPKCKERPDETEEAFAAVLDRASRGGCGGFDNISQALDERLLVNLWNPSRRQTDQAV